MVNVGKMRKDQLGRDFYSMTVAPEQQLSRSQLCLRKRLDLLGFGVGHLLSSETKMEFCLCDRLAEAKRMFSLSS